MQEVETVGSGGAAAGTIGESRDQQDELLAAGDDGGDQQLDDLESALLKAVERIADLERQLAESKGSHDLERQLVEAGVLDLETATMLAERRLAGSDATVVEVVADLTSSKSFLFRTKRKVPGGSAVSGGPASVADPISRGADESPPSNCNVTRVVSATRSTTPVRTPVTG